MTFLKKISSTDQDEDLLAAYKATTNPAVLGELYQRYMELVYGVCLQYLKDPEQAKDAVLSIYEELVTKLLKYEVQHFRPWLYQLARNYCLMKLRKRKGMELSMDPGLMQSADNWHPEEAMEKEKNLADLEDCISRLAGQQRDAIQLFYLQERSYKEISDQIQLDVGTVRSYIQNGRRNLKICMEKKALEQA